MGKREYYTAAEMTYCSSQVPLLTTQSRLKAAPTMRIDLLYFLSLLFVQALLDRFEEEGPGHCGVAENLGKAATVLPGHELSPGYTL